MTHPPLFSRRPMAAALALILTAVPAQGQARPQAPVVHAVLFYSPTCPHCHEVINRHLPPLRERFGEQFAIVGVDVTTEGGSALYEAAVDYYGLAPDRLGVPLVVIGDVALLGSREIPDRLPGLIEEGLADGGTPWPSLPALREALAAQGVIPRDSPQAPPTRSEAAPAADTARDAATATPASDTARAAPSAPDTDVPNTEASPGEPVETLPGRGEAAPGITTSLAPTPTTVASLTATDLFLQDPVGNGVAVAALLLLLA
ncbi:MAG TPA: hypothetical protein VJ997_14660, partial [Longimicrobiales bacterium]|nr:hypothetical protein [Longimicrobiales bacterium]